MATDESVSTDWQKSAGDFSCTVCERKRLPASEFSRKQVEKALDALKTIPDRDIRTGPEIQRNLFLTGVCKACTEKQEERERAEAQARREERNQAAAEAVLDQPEMVPAVLSERPFGMTPVKGEGVQGYLVAKATEGKPAAKAGVRPGWRLAEIGGSNCAGFGLEEVQALLKEATLPISVVFEAVPGGADFCTTCQQRLPAPLFSRKMRTRPPDKRRCTGCVEASEGGGAEGEEGPNAVGSDQAPQTKLQELQALCAESAQQAQKVTGLRAVRGAGRGRGRR